jgi:GH15 family glucan-1,4-alpha-glucosidase
MPSRIEDYALIGDRHTAALVARDGSIDWLCLPRFDSEACFAALLGTPEHGRWLVAPVEEVRACRRGYRHGTLILETEFETPSGSVTVTDFMTERCNAPVLVRIVAGRRGLVGMRQEIIIRFDYGSLIPWVRRSNGGITAIAGPDMVRVDSSVPLRGENFKTVADFSVAPGQRFSFILTWHPSHEPAPPPCDAEKALTDTEAWWRRWTDACTYKGDWPEMVLRSLLTLKGLTYAPTGGIVAAATTSLPEQLGGVRNWDYRFCWLRDSTFTLYALVSAGYHSEAAAWREWLLRALAGKPAQAQILYGLAGERRLTEWEVDWLPGYENSQPVRIGNAASNQFQLDVYGELIDSMYQCRRSGLEPDEAAWQLERALLDFLESAWKLPDEGIWEVRGPRRHFTHSKVMAWVALDRAVKSVERFGLDGPLERWRNLRSAIHDEVCQKGFNRDLDSFVQFYGSDELDASLLMIALVGFLPAADPRVRGTLTAIERDLMQDGFVARYANRPGVEGLPPGEGVFLPCTFWLADNLVLQGRHDEARQIFERLLGLCNDVGLISEEYDPKAKRLVGNFPQAFTHVGLVNTAHNLSQPHGPAEQRRQS